MSLRKTNQVLSRMVGSLVEQEETMFQTTTGEPVSVSRVIQRGDRVTIRTPQDQYRTGTAVMLGPAGWVLNMGGPHGTPGIASDKNVVKITRKGQRKPVYDAMPAGMKESSPEQWEMAANALNGGMKSWMFSPIADLYKELESEVERSAKMQEKFKKMGVGRTESPTLLLKIASILKEISSLAKETSDAIEAKMR